MPRGPCLDDLTRAAQPAESVRRDSPRSQPRLFLTGRVLAGLESGVAALGLDGRELTSRPPTSGTCARVSR